MKRWFQKLKETIMPDIREDEKVKELVQTILDKVKDLSEVVRVRVLQDLIAKLQARLDQRQTEPDQPDQSSPQ
jgi:hypothetical protein